MIDLRKGDCKEVLKLLPDNSVDSIVTDPPYELGFMGKSWDSTGIANDATMWSECLRVLKPGGHILAFSGTRTYHRMASAIEDAGFEVRDMIEWVYGCLSEDTEILTENGWKRYNFIENNILIYDIENDIYKWEKPQRWSEYSVYKDTAYRIKSDTTDQIVSRNHRCLVKRQGKLVFIKAEELDKMELMPILRNDIFSENKRESEILQQSMQRTGEGDGMEATRSQREGCLVEGNGRELQNKSIGGKEPIVEGWANLYKTEGEICEPVDKIRPVSDRIRGNGTEGWICNGTPFESSNGNKQTISENGVCASCEPQCGGQQNREFDAIQNERGTQKVRTQTSYNTTLATIEAIEYTGIIFCPTVSTGAFLARRNGKVFITGNSGFPKSLAIGKAIDKLQGNEREIKEERGGAIQKGSVAWNGNDRTEGKGSGFKEKFIDTKGTSEYEGWGTQLKPAHEPICMARKPLSEKSIAENCLKWGTGGINIDESRVGTEERYNAPAGNKSGGNSLNMSAVGMPQDVDGTTAIGRFPANLIHDGSDEVVACFPETKGALAPVKSGQKGFGGEIYGKYKQGGDDGASFYGDQQGSAARFFKSIIYQAKASKAERNKGCEGLELGEIYPQNNSLERKELNSTANKRVQNNHPTVKPVALMEYLITMVTPENGTVLEPFMGSGTTGVAAVNLNRNFIGIEMDEHYFEIAETRIKSAQKDKKCTELKLWN